ncbi:hypothetical protein ASD64_00965 [Mesorhizobium sp. Root157]|uniref:hypothetical protein n=1 Tax=Mesorhizobium sp. Root157 TaxID=1736477 RepID=UPI0006F3A5F0|nr:hypothetical protein [Mesorhizobium sp. Root157]KRA00178.1 hypothetical protein ASD64_00965 [Mesorhizobium sp. Root157]
MRLSFGLSSLAVTTLLAVGYSSPADAWSRHHDHVYADSFGNLVIDSAAGYKRILVGEGHMARKLANYTATGEPGVIHFNEHIRAGAAQDCYRPPVLVKGRSYMYGLSDGEMPQLSPCR